jgi:hypothetical protein
MAETIALLDVVALLEDLAQQGLARGQVGTVVEILAPDVYEVEFSDNTGRTYATASLHLNQLMVLHHEPAHSA